MATCLEDDARCSILEQECTAAANAPVVPVSLNKHAPASASAVRGLRSLREGVIIALVTTGLVLVPSVQSLGLSVEPVAVRVAGAPEPGPFESVSRAVVSGEVAALLASD